MSDRTDASTSDMNRRTLLERIGATVVCGGPPALAGCVGREADPGDESDSTTFRYGAAGTEQTNCLDCSDPYGAWALADRLAEDSRGTLEMRTIDGGQICDEQSCVGRIENGTVQVASTSVGNSTKFAPENNVWMLPYLFPPNDRAAISRTLFHEEVWERYWVPFARKYGIIPFLGYPMHHRVIHIGESAAADVEGGITRPEHVAGEKIRRTESRVSANAIGRWGASPVSIAWGDTIQGLQSGLVAGLETWLTNVAAFGMLGSLDRTIMTNWSLGCQMDWASVEWLRSLEPDRRALVADRTRSLTNELIGMTDEVIEERVGATSPPPAGSPFDDNGVTVHELSDDQLEAWRDPVDYARNPGVYEKTFEEAGDVLGGPEAAREFADFLHDLSREDAVPESVEDVEVTSWWDDHLDAI